MHETSRRVLRKIQSWSSDGNLLTHPSIPFWRGNQHGLKSHFPAKLRRESTNRTASNKFVAATLSQAPVKEQTICASWSLVALILLLIVSARQVTWGWLRSWALLAWRGKTGETIRKKEVPYRYLMWTSKDKETLRKATNSLCFFFHFAMLSEVRNRQGEDGGHVLNPFAPVLRSEEVFSSRRW